jgi:hypothetical protein
MKVTPIGSVTLSALIVPAQLNTGAIKSAARELNHSLGDYGHFHPNAFVTCVSKDEA